MSWFLPNNLDREKLAQVPGMDENPLSASVGSLFHELRGAVTFILGIYEALDQKLPDTAQELWNDFGRISEQTLINIEDQLGVHPCKYRFLFSCYGSLRK